MLNANMLNRNKKFLRYSFANLRLRTSLKVKVAEVSQYQQHNIKHKTVIIQG